MKKLTKNVLLRYAMHPSAEINEAYGKKLCDELLKKGMISIEDIPFNDEEGLTVGNLFVSLTNCVLEYCETSKVWDTYFEIADKIKTESHFVAHGIMLVYKICPNETIKARCYQWLKEFPQTEWEIFFIADLLEAKPFNHELAKIALERCKGDINTAELVFGGVIEQIPSCSFVFNLIKVLAEKKEPEVCVFLLIYCMRIMDTDGYTSQMLKLLPIIVKNMTSIEGLSNEDCANLSCIYRSDCLDAKTYFKIIEKLTSLATADNQKCLLGLTEGLVYAAFQSRENLPQVIKLIKKQLDILCCKSEICQVLYALSSIAYHYRDNENFATEILPPVKKLFLRKVDALSGNTPLEAYLLNRTSFYEYWADMDTEVLFEIIKNTPAHCNYELIHFITTKHTELWEKSFAKLNISERNVFPIICELADVYANIFNRDEVKAKIYLKIEELLKNFYIIEGELFVLCKMFQQIEGLAPLADEAEEKNARKLKEIMSLLD